MTNLSKSVLDKIKKGNIKPKSRLYFVLIHVTLWSFAVLSVALGGLAIAVILRHFLLTDWMILRQASGGSLRSFVTILPYLWFLFMGLTFFFAKYLFAHTKNGYKFKPVYISIASVLLSVVVGSLFFTIKLDVPVETSLREHVRPYNTLQQHREKMFVAPDRGVLPGRIIKIDADNKIVIIDPKNNEWLIDISDALIKDGVNLKEGERVMVIGKKESNGLFSATEVRQFKKRDMRRKKMKENKTSLRSR